MNTFINLLNKKIEKVFLDNNLDTKYAKCDVSKKENFGDYQINSCMAIAKLVNMKPIDLASKIASILEKDEAFTKVEAVMPGFVNLTLSEKYIRNYFYDLIKTIESNECKQNEEIDCYQNFIYKKYLDGYLGVDLEKNKQTIIVDYGGANVAKPLHIGHLRSAVIGECIKRLLLRKGNICIGDVHLGDYGLQMGLTIKELMDENLAYEENGKIVCKFNILDLERVYPLASKKAKETLDDGTLKNEQYALEAHKITKFLQEEKEPYFSIWKQIVEVSKVDLKKNYDALDVHFELWNGEACVNKYIPDLIEKLINEKIAIESKGALVVDVKEETDKIEIPPCIIRKSDGAVLYATTDLATIIDREKNIDPDKYIYITDGRQSLHFVQVYRTAKKATLFNKEKTWIHIGFGTMNGKDGKPFKTRDGGILKLESLLQNVHDMAKEKMKEDNGDATASKIALAALKYGDLSNIAEKDYIFDIEKFVSFEGNTGPYILYTIVRIKSILNKLNIEYDDLYQNKIEVENLNDKAVKKLELLLIRYNEELDNAYNELAPYKLCSYIYSLSNSVNTFYHEHSILKEENENLKKYYIQLISMAKLILEDAIYILGFDAPEKM